MYVCVAWTWVALSQDEWVCWLSQWCSNLRHLVSFFGALCVCVILLLPCTGWQSPFGCCLHTPVCTLWQCLMLCVFVDAVVTARVTHHNTLLTHVHAMLPHRAASNNTVTEFQLKPRPTTAQLVGMPTPGLTPKFKQSHGSD